jgi:hypothetical protein
VPVSDWPGSVSCGQRIGLVGVRSVSCGQCNARLFGEHCCSSERVCLLAELGVFLQESMIGVRHLVHVLSERRVVQVHRCALCIEHLYLALQSTGLHQEITECGELALGLAAQRSIALGVELGALGCCHESV